MTQLIICRNKFGVKAVMGRTNVGPFAFATGRYLAIKRALLAAMLDRPGFGALAADDEGDGGGGDQVA